MRDQRKNLLEANEVAEICKILNIKYGAKRGKRQFSLEHSYEEHSDSCLLTIILQNEDQSFHYPIEGQITCKSQNLAPKEALMVLIDFVDSYIDEYFREDENSFMPIDWKEFNLEGHSFYLRGQIRNLMLENQADKLLEAGFDD